MASIGALTATVLLTGAFHEDGLADTFDGIGVLAGSDELFDAVKLVTLSIPARTCADGTGVRARMRFGERKPTERFAARKRRQVSRLLRLVSKIGTLYSAVLK